MTLSFRPHHFLCTLGFQGKGYSPYFIDNYEDVASTLRHTPDLPIQVVSTHDSICRACPHQKTTGCAQEDKIHLLDQAHSQILGLKIGDVLSWRQARVRLKQHMTLEAFHQACATCAWKPLGLCEHALQSLRDEDDETSVA